MRTNSSVKILLGIAAIVAMSACSGAGAADGSNRPTDSSTGLTTMAASQPFRHASSANEWVASPHEATCIRDARSHPKQVDCVGKPSLIATQTRYLREHSHATQQEIACATRSLEQRDLARARALAVNGVGLNADGPCWLPR